MKKRHLEKREQYKGIFYKVVLQRYGHRCGYVEIPKDLNISKRDFSFDSDLEVHGGITYAEVENETKVIGFDCAHYMDSPDVKNTLKHFTDLSDNELMFLSWSIEDGKVRSLEYVEKECKNLIDKLLEKYNYGGEIK